MADVQDTKNALWRRDEQVKRWQLSETNLSPIQKTNKTGPKIRFQDGCVFLAACSSGDTDEVERLLAKGADINTANIDGLTALHQACIDDNVLMVEFLIDHGADINACDNEGWTPLHATASCGFVKVAKYLIDHSANLAAVNNEGELCYDLAVGDDMEDLISKHMDEQGIDAEAARREEQEIMMSDANMWLNSNHYEETPHPKTGATALHVAAAKGYVDVMKILLQAKAEIDVQDIDGWSPLHAAAHWGQEETCKLLVDNFCNMDLKNNAGQTPMDIADQDLDSLLEQLKKKQATLIKDREENENKLNNIATTRNAFPGKRRSSVTRMSVDQKLNVGHKTAEEERVQLEALRTVQDHEEEEPLKSSEDSQDDESREESEEDEDDSEDEEEEEEDKSPPVDTAKRNELNKQVSSLPSQTQVNGEDKQPSTTPVEPADTVPSILPPSTPSIQDIIHSKTKDGSTQGDVFDVSSSQDDINPAPDAGVTLVRTNNLLISEQEKQEREKEEKREKEIQDEKERLERAKLQKERLERERIEKERVENERLEKERLENERLEKERLENERLEKERLENERLEKERQEKDRQEKERQEKERQRENLEKERKAKEQQEKERLDKERREKARLEREKEREDLRLKREAEKRMSARADSLPCRLDDDSAALMSEATTHKDTVFTKLPLSRVVSLPTSPATTSERQVASNIPRQLSVSEKREALAEGPSSWRAGLRKTPSSGTVPESSTSTNPPQDDKLLRSASSSWIHPEKADAEVRRRIFSATGDSAEVRASKTADRYSDFRSRYASLLASTSTPTTTTTTPASNTTSKVATTTSSSPVTLPTSTIASSTSYNYTPYSALNRRRPVTDIIIDDKSAPADRGDRGDRYSVLGLSSTRKTYELPKRDDEKEVERKVKAKRARESRRSTQGVSKEDMELAEKSLKDANKDQVVPSSMATTPTTTTTTTGDRSDKENRPEDGVAMRVRRAYVPANDKKETEESALSLYRKSRDSGVISSNNAVTSSGPAMSTVRTSVTSTPSVSVVGSTATTTVISSTTPSTTSFRTSYRAGRSNLPPSGASRSALDTTEEHVSEKEEPSHKSSAIRTRRKREYRRPTGKVTLDESQQASAEEQTDSKETDEKKDEDSTKSSSTPGRYSSRFSADSGFVSGEGSSSRFSRDRPSSASYSRSYSSTSLPESKSTEVDYKKLYEEEKQENERLKREVKKVQQDLVETKTELDRYKNLYESSRGTSESSSERREKRALERKISELEEELKQMETLKSNNQRLKDENGALIRVISKLSK